MAKQFAVLHIQKGNGSGGGLGSHIDRTRKVLNADPEKRLENFYIHSKTDTPGVEMAGMYQKDFEKYKKKTIPQAVEQRIAEGRTEGPRDAKGELKAIRKDAVKYLNVIFTGSHQPMKAMSLEQLQEWTKDNYRWACEEFGKKNIVRFGVHMDERTPHIHCTVVPLTTDGRLSAKDVMGNKIKMSDRQTRYAEAMEKYGLQRGVKGSKAKHEEVSEYYGRIDEAKRSEISLPKPKFMEMGSQYMKRAEESLKALKMAYDEVNKELKRRGQADKEHSNLKVLSVEYEKILYQAAKGEEIRPNLEYFKTTDGAQLVIQQKAEEQRKLDAETRRKQQEENLKNSIQTERKKGRGLGR